jgi:putative ABC transport system permease protein
MLKNYFKIAWRTLIKHKVSSAISILGLAIGICACMVIYLTARFELSFDNFHPGKERIYRAVRDIDNGTGVVDHKPTIPYSAALIIRNQFTGTDKVACFFNYYFKVTVPDGRNSAKRFDAGDQSKDPSDIIITEPEYFDIFMYDWLAGNPNTALNEPFKVVLAESRARKYFGTLSPEEMMGREVIYDDSLRLKVAGIVKDFPNNTDLIFKDFISFPTIKSSFLNNRAHLQGVTEPDGWGNSDYEQAFVQLSKGVTSAHFNAQTGSLVKTWTQHGQGLANSKVTVRLQPLSDIHFNVDYGSDFYSRQAHLPTLYVLMAIAAFMLIIAAINFANLSTAQSTQRAKEIGIRKVLGSNRIRLGIQFLCEAFLMALFSAILSLVLLNPALNAFQGIIPPGMVIPWFSLFAFLFIITIVTSLLAGIYPAKVLSSYQPALTLKGQGAGTPNHKAYLRKALIVFQFTISILFIIGSIVINSQIHFMLNKDLGFKKDAIVNVSTSVNYPRKNKYVLAEKIRGLSGVDMVSVSQDLPEENGTRGGALYCQDKGTEIQALYRACDDHYIPLYGIKMIAGRNFNAPSGNDSLTEFLINESCARQLGFKRPEDAIGYTLQAGGRGKTRFYAFCTGPVVGIVGDFHAQPLNTAIQPTCIMAAKNLYYGLLNVRLSTSGRQINDLKGTMANIEKQWAAIYPNERFEYSFFDRTIAGFYDEQQKTSEIIKAAMVIAIFISCMGLFGLAAFTAVQRTKEIGIRKVLGASVAGIATLMIREFVLLVGLGILVASPIAWYFMHNWLQSFSYRISMNAWVFLLAGLSAIFIALVTVGSQAIKAALANPIKSLKTE